MVCLTSSTVDLRILFFLGGGDQTEIRLPWKKKNGNTDLWIRSCGKLAWSVESTGSDWCWGDFSGQYCAVLTDPMVKASNGICIFFFVSPQCSGKRGTITAGTIALMRERKIYERCKYKNTRFSRDHRSRNYCIVTHDIYTLCIKYTQMSGLICWVFHNDVGTIALREMKIYTKIHPDIGSRLLGVELGCG